MHPWAAVNAATLELSFCLIRPQFYSTVMTALTVARNILTSESGSNSTGKCFTVHFARLDL